VVRAVELAVLQGALRRGGEDVRPLCGRAPREKAQRIVDAMHHAGSMQRSGVKGRARSQSRESVPGVIADSKSCHSTYAAYVQPIDRILASGPERPRTSGSPVLRHNSTFVEFSDGPRTLANLGYCYFVISRSVVRVHSPAPELLIKTDIDSLARSLAGPLKVTMCNMATCFTMVRQRQRRFGLRAGSVGGGAASVSIHPSI
jgi:hypothetical protein